VPDDFDDEPITAPICLACGGDWEREVRTSAGHYSLVRCRWCTKGGMNLAQLAAWKAWRDAAKR
jgi:hypothetical protein